jgi:arylsulfatase A-like enzyme
LTRARQPLIIRLIFRDVALNKSAIGGTEMLAPTNPAHFRPQAFTARLLHKFATRILIVTIAALLIPSGKITRSAEPGRVPNIVLILADDLGFSDLGCFGGEIRTPHLDGLAADGLRLTRMYTTARCCPSRASLLTGQYSHRIGLGHMVGDLGLPGYRGRPSDDAVTIAQVLNAAGYRSFLSGKWHLGTDDPTQYGFEEFYGTLVSAKTFWDPNHLLRLPKGRAARQYAEGDFYATDAVTDHALDFLALADQTPERPWFMHLPYHAPHFPLHARAEDLARYKDVYERGWDAIRQQRLARMKKLGIVGPETRLPPRSRYWDWQEATIDVNPAWESLPADRRRDLARRMAVYAAMVDRLDQNVGRLLNALREREELDKTLIVFLSDNGACAEWDPHGFDGQSGPENILHRGDDLEGMGGPGTYHSVGSGWANASNTPWRLYKHFGHEGGISTACIVHWPGELKRHGEIDDRPAHLIDLLPTFLEAASADYPQTIAGRTPLRPAGRSLLPQWRGEPVDNRPLFFEHEGHRAVHQDHWKLVALRGAPWELYDMRTDRTELHNLAEQRPEVVSALSRAWDQWAGENQVTPFPRDYGVGYLKAVD